MVFFNYHIRSIIWYYIHFQKMYSMIVTKLFSELIPAWSWFLYWQGATYNGKTMTIFLDFTKELQVFEKLLKLKPYEQKKNERSLILWIISTFQKQSFKNSKKPKQKTTTKKRPYWCILRSSNIFHSNALWVQVFPVTLSRVSTFNFQSIV